MFRIIDTEPYEHREIAQYTERPDAELHLTLMDEHTDYAIVETLADLNLDKLRAGYRCFQAELTEMTDGTTLLSISQTTGFKEYYIYCSEASRTWRRPSEALQILAKDLDDAYNIFEVERDRLRKTWEEAEYKRGESFADKPVLEVGKKAVFDTSVGSVIWPVFE